MSEFTMNGFSPNGQRCIDHSNYLIYSPNSNYRYVGGYSKYIYIYIMQQTREELPEFDRSKKKKNKTKREKIVSEIQTNEKTFTLGNEMLLEVNTVNNSNNNVKLNKLAWRRNVDAIIKKSNWCDLINARTKCYEIVWISTSKSPNSFIWSDDVSIHSMKKKYTFELRNHEQYHINQMTQKWGINLNVSTTTKMVHSNTSHSEEKQKLSALVNGWM